MPWEFLDGHFRSRGWTGTQLRVFHDRCNETLPEEGFPQPNLRMADNVADQNALDPFLLRMAHEANRRKIFGESMGFSTPTP